MKPVIIAASVGLVVLACATTSSAQECRRFDAGVQVAALSDPEIDEASGLATSWLNEGIFWTHNDSGDSARVFGIDANGQTVTVVALAGVTAIDIEDIAVGPCSSADPTPCVWVADIGDNDERRPSVALYRFPEPVLGEQPAPTLQVTPTTISVTYDGGPRNAETLMVHPVDARVFIVDKTVGDPSNVWIVPTDGTTPASLIATTSLGEVGIVSGRITGGDFAPDGREFSVRTYTHIYTFCGDDPAAAFEATPSSVIGTRLFQSEALTYSRDGQRLYTTTEVQTTEQPKVLEMRVIAAPGEDMGGEPTNNNQGAPDVGQPPAPDMRIDPRADTRVKLLDDYNNRSCSCRVAATNEAEHLAVLGLVGFGVVLRRRRSRTRLQST